MIEMCLCELYMYENIEVPHEVKNQRAVAMRTPPPPKKNGKDVNI